MRTGRRRKSLVKKFDEATRTWICRTWVDLGCPEPEEWHDRGGAISSIQKALRLPQGSSRTIRNVLEDAQYCLLTGHNFDPETKDGSGGANKLVKHGSKTEHLIAKYMEGGYGVKQTTVHVNAWRKANTTLGPLGVSAVYSAHKRLDPEMTRVKSRKQGSYDAESKWAKARYHWVSQLMIRLSEWKPDLAELKAAKLVKDDAASIPACFDFTKLTPLEHPAENGCPSSARIVQDVMRFMNALNSIFKHEGAVVHGKYLRNGDRKLPKGEGHGGNRTKNVEEDAEKWLHKDAEGCIATFNEDALADFVE